MNLLSSLLAALLLLLATPVNPDKLSVLLPNQNVQFDLDHNPEIDPRSSSINSGLSPPLFLPIPPISQLPLADAPAPLPTGPLLDTRTNLVNSLQDRVPLISALYELPDVEEKPSGSSPSQGTCEAQTVVVTSRHVIVSTSVSRVGVPTTVVQWITTTQVQLQTALQTSYITLPALVQTRTVTRVVPETVYVTTTRLQHQVVTSTQLLVQTQLVTSRFTDYVTQTQTSLVYQTVYSTQVRPTYITTTFTQYATPSCPTYTTTGYDYTAPAETGLDYPTPTGPSIAYGYGHYGSYYGTEGGGHKGPAFSHQKGPAYAHQKGPAYAHQKGPAYAHQKGPAFTHQKGAVFAHQKGPAFTHQKGPAFTHQKGPAFTHQKGAVFGHQKGPAFTHQKGADYAPYYHAPYYQPVTRRKKMFGGWGFAG